jgi:bilirubin oxidase
MTRLLLAPAERAELLINLTGMEGDSLELLSYGSTLPQSAYGIAGLSTMQGVAPSGYNSNELNGNDFILLDINVCGQTDTPILTIPNTLVDVSPIDESEATITRALQISAPNMMQNSVTGPFQFDGESFDMDVINQTVQLGDTEIWEIFNMSMVAHPFHIHDVQFYILDRNGIIPPENEQGRKDVVLIKQMETVRFIAKFEDHADDEVPYMYHCHMLQHEDEGLMGQFIVVGESIGIDANVTLPIDFSLFPVYPNPFNPTTTIRFNLVGMQRTASLRIYDISGQLVETLVNEKLNAGEHEIKWNAVNQSSGVYFIRLQSGGFFETEKIVLMK